MTFQGLVADNVGRENYQDKCHFAMHEQQELLRFDPYHEWLGIPPAEQPPNHYRLLGLSLFESNPTVIVNAADRQMAHLRTFATGPRGMMTQPLANQIAEAAGVLTAPERKATYDAALHYAFEQVTIPWVIELPVESPPPLPPMPPPMLAAHPKNLVDDFCQPQYPPPLRQTVPQAERPPYPERVIHAEMSPLQIRRPTYRRRTNLREPTVLVVEIAKIVVGGIAGIALGFVIIYWLTGLDPEEFLRNFEKAVTG